MSEAKLEPTLATCVLPIVVFFAGDWLDSHQCVRICVLIRVAWGPIAETGVSAPSYSSGIAA